jgi:hypothetical protein
VFLKNAFFALVFLPLLVFATPLQVFFFALVGVPGVAPFFFALVGVPNNAFAGVLHLQTQPSKVLLVKNTNSGECFALPPLLVFLSNAFFCPCWCSHALPLQVLFTCKHGRTKCCW